jgi:hypothetical protein
MTIPEGVREEIADLASIPEKRATLREVIDYLKQFGAVDGLELTAAEEAYVETNYMVMVNAVSEHEGVPYIAIAYLCTEIAQGELDGDQLIEA